MAAVNILQKLQEKLTCSICLKGFLDPATLDCGHNFCHSCLVGCWGCIPTQTTCPQCKEVLPRPIFTPNRQLANIVMLTKEMSDRAKRMASSSYSCEQHPEAVTSFCKDDLTPICSICDHGFQNHHAHDIIPVAEAAQTLKDHLLSSIVKINKKKENILQQQIDEETRCISLLRQMEEEREVMKGEFKVLHQFLTQQENTLLLNAMEELQKNMMWKKAQHAAIIHREASDLDVIIQDLKRKYHQPTLELLQDVRSTLEKCNREIVVNRSAFSTDTKMLVWYWFDFNAFLEKSSTQFQETMLSGYEMLKVNVTFDPDTAHPKLILSEDRKSLKVGRQRQQLPERDGRFDQMACVLGCEKFLKGRCYWDILLGKKGDWGVGVARNSMRRKGLLPIRTMEGIWAVAKCANRWLLICPPDYFYINMDWEVKTLRVSVNYIGRRVTFYDADRGNLIHTYSRDSFSGEPLRPIFWLRGKGQLTIRP